MKHTISTSFPWFKRKITLISPSFNYGGSWKICFIQFAIKVYVEGTRTSMELWTQSQGHLSSLSNQNDKHVWKTNTRVPHEYIAVLPMSNSIVKSFESSILILSDLRWYVNVKVINFLTNLWVKTPVLCINPAFPAPAPKTGTPALESETKRKTLKKLCISSKTEDKHACMLVCVHKCSLGMASWKI